MHYERRLEKLCRYAARPPIVEDRLSLLPDGRVLYALKRRFRDGSTPAPPLPGEGGHEEPVCAHQQNQPAAPQSAPTSTPSPHQVHARRRRPRSRYSWAELLRRVFLIDVLTCPHCGGRRRLLAAIHDQIAIRRILDHLGLAADPPLIASARAPPAPLLPW